jgi:hypothetical protein
MWASNWKFYSPRSPDEPSEWPWSSDYTHSPKDLSYVGALQWSIASTLFSLRHVGNLQALYTF